MISGAMTADGGCEACQLIKYTPGPQGVSGTSYRSNSPLDLTGAKIIVFFVKGELGGETVQFCTFPTTFFLVQILRCENIRPSCRAFVESGPNGHLVHGATLAFIVGFTKLFIKRIIPCSMTYSSDTCYLYRLV